MAKISIWHGADQRFGHLDQPQRWINILGSVDDPQALSSLTMRVNGGEYRKLSVGPDGLRLRGSGDFNAEIPVVDLKNGINEVNFIAVYSLGQIISKKVRVAYSPQKIWPLPYSILWKKILQPSDAVQVVDGYWWLTDNGIRPVNPSYDRLVAVGDCTWTDVIVRATATLHGFVPGENGRLQGGFGILMRWTGHYLDTHQPSREWRPSGAIGWYRARWEDDPPMCRNFNISDAVIEDRAVVETPPVTLGFDRPVVFEMSVKSQPSSTSLYRFRVWYADKPETLLCNLTASGTPGESPQGSILFIALYADVTIGDIEVVKNV